MGATSQIELARLTVRVPRGQDGFWKIMRDLDRKVGSFTMTDVEGATNVPRSAVEHYINRLHKGGFLSKVGHRDIPQSPFPAIIYRLAKKPAHAPRLRDDGSPVPPSAQQRMWTAMRTPRGRAFDAKTLAFEASMPKAKVPNKTAQRYINQLEVAGYLNAAGRGAYRLKPKMDTGPLPPSILKIDAVWDRNLKKLIGPDVHDAREAGEAA